MRKKTPPILLLCLMTMVIAKTAICQEAGTKSIIVKRLGSPEDNFKFIGNYFLNKGFGIEKKSDYTDFDFLQLTFKPIKFFLNYKRDEKLFYLIITARAEQDSIVITAQHKLSGTRRKPTIYDPKKKEIVEAFKILTELTMEINEDITFSNQ